METHIIVSRVLGSSYCEGSNTPILGPRLHWDHFWAHWLSYPSRRAVLLNGQILAEAEPALIWTDQRWCIDYLILSERTISDQRPEHHGGVAN